jgi:hypothetical protein
MISTFPALGLRGANGMRFMLFATLAAGMLSMNAGRGTLAFFTTQVTSTGNTFTAGNLRFNISDANVTSGQYPSLGSSLSMTNFKPGAAPVVAPIKLSNVGTLDAKYGIKYSTSSALAANINGYTISAPTTTTFQELGRAASSHTYYSTLTNDYLVITGGAGVPAVNKISSNTADTLTVATAWTTNPDSTTQYLVANYAGSTTSAPTTTTVTDTGAAWTPNQWVNYSVTIGGSTAKIVSNTGTVLTVSPAFSSAPASGVYYISPTNLAPALQLAIVGKGTGSGTATTADCNLANFGSTTLWQDVNIQVTPTNMSAGGATILDVTQPAGTGAGVPRALLSGASDVLCIQVKWPDGGAPPSLTGGDNAFNGATAGGYATVLNFAFDGQ